ncbi:MAG: hypothetical protein ACM3NQ_00460 [Bacteroidales bacterium]
MKRRALLAVGCLSLFVASPFASQASDPVTGHWGEAGQTFLELQFDGKNTVTGTVILHRPGQPNQRAAIKTGTFDTRTGELKLTGEADRDGKVVPYLIEGKIADDVLTGRSNLGGERKSFKFSRQ